MSPLPVQVETDIAGCWPRFIPTTPDAGCEATRGRDEASATFHQLCHGTRGGLQDAAIAFRRLYNYFAQLLESRKLWYLINSPNP